MPTYSYACTACEHRFDAVQAFTDSSLTECPSCSGRLRKLFSSVGIVFKGSGFYRTDSRSAPVGAGEGNGGSKSDSSKSDSSKSDSSASSKSSSDKSSSDKSSSDKSSASASSSSSSSSSSSTSAAASS